MTTETATARGFWLGPAIRTLLIGLAGALATWFLTPHHWAVAVRLLCAWCIFAVVKVVAVLRHIGADGDRTESYARRDDDGRSLAGLIVLSAAVMSLGGVANVLRFAHDAHGSRQAWLTTLALGTVALSWSLVHSEYLVRYARQFYADRGGIEFPVGGGDHEQNPDMRDFAYLAFCLGMTYQVSDTNITSKAMRRLVSAHVLISYVFGAVIVAVTINVVAGFVSG
jgi:uncharacterized membrane protein